MSGPDSEVAALADRAVSALTRQDPVLAITLGLPAEGLTDYSPDACAARIDTLTALTAEARSVPVGDDGERIARDVLVERLTALADLGHAEEHLRDLNILVSPPQSIRQALELLPPDAAPDAAAERLAAVAPALAGWRESLLLGVRRGRTAASRQAVAVAEQLGVYARDWLPHWAARFGGDPAVAAAADAAAAAFGDTAVWLADVYAATARPDDAVGEELYRLHCNRYTGADLDLDDTFTWGFAEVERLAEELRREAAAVEPGLAPPDLRARLDADPRYRIDGVPALIDHLRVLTERATAAVDGVVFDIDPRVRPCEVRIAAAGAAAAPYYVPPSEDLRRPGTTWYPTRGRDRFPRWWLTSIWYHEAVPGHHLQLGGHAVQGGLTRFQRTLGWTSGHAEGWAMYAERLCDELGWFDDPGTRIGYLSGQLLRAVRVVVDIGLHTGRRVPAGFRNAGARIDAAAAQRLLVDRALLDPDVARSEVDRYLGLPGQAISYKVGQREWLAARSRAQAAAGPAFDLRRWHGDVLGLGPMGLAQFGRESAATAR